MDFGFFVGIGYEMGSLSMTEKGFWYDMGSVIRTNLKIFFCLTYECIMKFMPFEWIEICTLSRENVVYFD